MSIELGHLSIIKAQKCKIFKKNNSCFSSQSRHSEHIFFLNSSASTIKTDNKRWKGPVGRALPWIRSFDDMWFPCKNISYSCRIINNLIKRLHWKQRPNIFNYRQNKVWLVLSPKHVKTLELLPLTFHGRKEQNIETDVRHIKIRDED